MKRLILAIAALAAVMAIMTVPVSSGDTAEGPTVIGISSMSKSGLQIAITEDSTIAYKDVVWYVYVPSDGHVTGTDSLGSIIDSDLTAGLYTFERSYTSSSESVTWTINGETIVRTFRVAASTQEAYDYTQSTSISIPKGFLEQQEREIAIGCIALVLAPSLFVIPFWKKRKDMEVENVFD